MQFRDIDGYENLKEHLRSMTHSRKIPHNILLEIQDGMPGIAMALAWVQYLNCLNPQDGDSCGTCAQCKMISQLEHPDVHFIFPVIDSADVENPSDNYLPQWRDMVLKHGAYWGSEEWLQALNPENKQPIIYSKDAYALEQKLQLTIGYASYRCIIIYQPDKMNEEASNKLLKTMEEPPERTLFISVSFRPDLLLETVQSRMQTIEMAPLSHAEMREAIARIAPSNTASNTIDTIVQRSQGLVLKAKRLLENKNAEKKYITYFDMLTNAMLNKEIIVFRTLSEQLHKEGRAVAINMLEYFEECFRTLMRESLIPGSIALLSSDEQRLLNRIKVCVTPQNIKHLYHLSEQGIRHIRGYVSPKIVLFDTFIRYTAIFSIELKKQQARL
ncbi:DNA polymerase III subunit [Porphyromonas circumdentaria]|uniref:DNA polymerase-3 subunit delta n=1 Tax=Porphyromonas circumdentaria TaxID=29524 RepID=A0A1T4MK84_9PORP|nr:hypothetical protein [Porphyromonas circumdentaria]MBB6275840.1 DNA polymerase-3 subunit delta' [Porphyromonas circumdentaria]MDO4722384.1 hypothetical protein [Porphyromonas circumdentaria]SJZ67363.1 DNA polymerase-3 subunit delta' [Porphyromonas circumdentaria]